MFNTQKRKVKENLEKAILSLYEIKQIAYNGNERFSELSTGSLETESYDHLLDEFSTQLNESLTLTDAGKCSKCTESIKFYNIFVEN